MSRPPSIWMLALAWIIVGALNIYWILPDYTDPLIVVAAFCFLPASLLFLRYDFVRRLIISCCLWVVLLGYLPLFFQSFYLDRLIWAGFVLLMPLFFVAVGSIAVLTTGQARRHFGGLNDESSAEILIKKEIRTGCQIYFFYFLLSGVASVLQNNLLQPFQLIDLIMNLGVLLCLFEICFRRLYIPAKTWRIFSPLYLTWVIVYVVILYKTGALGAINLYSVTEFICFWLDRLLPYVPALILLFVKVKKPEFRLNESL